LDKLEDLVTFPLRNLDMQRFLLHGLQTNSTYDLFAVVNHHIYQTGGHYTAAVQLESTVWALSNDSAVTQVRNPGADLVHKDAYMLFYKRKEFTPSNILKLATH
jgi:ubiquitin C-terminal hydrolase